MKREMPPTFTHNATALYCVAIYAIGHGAPLREVMRMLLGTTIYAHVVLIQHSRGEL